MENLDLKLIKATDRVYYTLFNADNDWPSLAVVVGDDHTMMLDAGRSKRQVDLFLKELEANNLPKPDLCAITHWHWDHTYGLAHLEGVTSFATKETNKLLKNMEKWQWSDRDMKKRIETGEDLQFSYEFINMEYPDKSLIKVKHADVEYEDKLTVDLGGVTVKLKAVENSHSYDCAIFHIPEEKVIFTGDTLYRDLLPKTPSYYRESNAKLISALRKMDFDTVITGHHVPMTNEEVFVMLNNVEYAD